MTAPALARKVGSGRVYVWPDEPDLRYPSVTTIAGTLSKGGLVPWAAKAVAATAINDIEYWRAQRELFGDEAAVDQLKKTADEQRDAAADTGTAVHAAIEALILDRERPHAGDLEPYLRQFDAWAEAFNPQFTHVEVTVFNPGEGYAGTFDAIALIPACGRVLIDHKTGNCPADWDRKTRSKGPCKGAYPDMGLQQAAYRYAPWYARWAEDIQEWEKWRMPEVDGTWILHLRPDHFTFTEVLSRRDYEYQSFLALRDVWQWKKYWADKGTVLRTIYPGAARPALEVVE